METNFSNLELARIFNSVQQKEEEARKTRWAGTTEKEKAEINPHLTSRRQQLLQMIELNQEQAKKDSLAYNLKLSSDQIETKKAKTQERNFLSKQSISFQLKSNKINYFLAPMGTGKTTASKELIKDYLDKNQKVLVLTPYLASAREYMNDDILKKTVLNHKGKKQIEEQLFGEKIRYSNQEQNSNFKLIESKMLIIEYPMILVEKIVNQSLKLSKSDFTNTNKYVAHFRVKAENYLNNFDLIILDELDFVETQGKASTKSFTQDGQKLNLFDFFIAFLKIGLEIRKTFIAVSANKFPLIKEHTIRDSEYILNSTNKNRKIEEIEEEDDDVIVEYLEGSEAHKSHLFNRKMINYRETSLTSNQNIKKLVVIEYDPKLDFTKFQADLIRGTKNTKAIFFNNKKWSKQALKAGREANSHIYLRKENLNIKIDKKTKKAKIDELDGYKNLHLIDKKINLSNETFKNTNSAMINLSSSRALSITDNYDSAICVAFAQNCSTAVTQAWGRFRYSEVTLYIIRSSDKTKLLFDQTGLNAVAEYIKEHVLATKDPFLNEIIEDNKLEYFYISSNEELNALNEPLKALSTSSHSHKSEKRASFESFTDGTFKDYLQHCEANGYQHVYSSSSFYRLRKIKRASQDTQPEQRASFETFTDGTFQDYLQHCETNGYKNIYSSSNFYRLRKIKRTCQEIKKRKKLNQKQLIIH